MSGAEAQRVIVRWRGVAWMIALVAVAGCTEQITAPARCPDFCPPAAITMIDSILPDAVGRDSSFRGYVVPHTAGTLQLVDGTGVGIAGSRGVIVFNAFPRRIVLNPSDTTTVPVAQVDSFQLTLTVVRRPTNVAGLQVIVYRLPVTVDSTVTYAGLDPYFVDSLRIGAIAVPDSLVTDTVTLTLPVSAFPTFGADSLRAAVGLRLQAPKPAYLDVGASESGAGASLTRYAEVDSVAGVRVQRFDAAAPNLDTFAGPAMPAAPAGGALEVGGVPAARTLLRVTLPARVLDSARVVRATLVLTQVEPALGAAGDTVVVLADGVTADVGPKSPLIGVPADSIPFQSASVVVGSADSVMIDVTPLVAGWQVHPDRPRTIVLRAVPEGARFGEVRLAPAGAAGGPRLWLTFIPPPNLGGR